MATLTNTKIKDTYKSLLKVSDNGNLEGGLQEITDGEGNASGVQLNTGGDLTASGTVAFGSLKDSGENITIAKFVDEADGIAGNDNDTSIPTSAAVKDYVDTNVTAQDLDFVGDSGSGAVDLDSQNFSIQGTTNEVVTSASGQTLTIGLPSSISVDVVGDLTGNVSGNVTGNLTGNVSGNVTGDVTGNLTGNVNGNVTGNVTGDLTGNADTASQLATARNIVVSGDVSGSALFDGSSDINISTIIQPDSVALGADTTGDYVANLGAGTGVSIGSNTGEGSNPTISVNYGSTSNTSVEGDTALTIQGTTNEIEVSGGAITLGTGGTVTVGLPDNVIIAGDLTVNGTTTTVNTETLSVEDPLIELANQNASNSVDSGFFADYSLDAGVTTKYAGLFKDAGDSDKFKLFKGLEVKPTTTVDTAGTGYTKGDLVVGDLDAVTISGDLTGDVTGDLTGTVLTAAQTNITSVGTLSSLAVSGNVGIGTTGAQELVVGGSATTQVSILSNTTTGKSQLYFGDADSVFRGLVDYDHSGDSMAFFTAAGERMRIDSSGNVGVGIIPSTKLDVLGVLRVRRDTNSDQYTEIESSGAVSFIRAKNNAASTYQALVFESGNNTTTTERMRIDSSGNVGIGTSSPYSIPKLTVSASASGGSQSGNDVAIFEKNSDAYIKVFSSTTGEGGIAFGDSDDGFIGALNYDHDGDYMRFYVNNSERMRIDSSGNVGIGISSPSEKLDVEGNIQAIDSGGVSGAYIDIVSGSTWRLASNPTSGTNSYGLDIIKGSAGTDIKLSIDSSGNVGIGTSTPDAEIQVFKSGNSRLRLETDDSGNSTVQFADSSSPNNGQIQYKHSEDAMLFKANGSERMRITSGGQVQINNPSAASDALNIEGLISGSSQYGIIVKNNSTLYTSYAARFENINTSSLVGSITMGVSATSYNTTSDYRLKENVVPMEGALDRVDALKPSRFNFIADPETTVDGFLAHEVADVIPEAITGEKDAVDEEGNPIYQGIDQSKIVPLLVGAIQELRAEVESLKSQLNA